ncbi:hypothetical protein KF728_16490 [Candidatus Obscuribacterales bacterium]|nr:hypothetical protein [Candidatus Obscuribacterales bacterium]
MSSRTSDLLKDSKPEHHDSGSDANAQPLSLTSVSDKPKSSPAPAKTDVAAATPAAEKPAAPTLSSASLFTTSLAKPTAAAPMSKLASLVSTNNEAQTRFEEKKNANVFERFGMGAVENLKGQAQGLSEMAFGKRDTMDELNSTLTGKKTGNEHALINVTKTTLTVGGVVKDLAADTVGLGDGKTSAALSRAITKAKDDFNKGSLGDKAEMAGSAFAFLGTLAIGGGGTAKGTAGLATDVRAMRTLIQTEKQTAALTEAVSGMRALRATEKVVAAVDRMAVAGGDDLTRIAATTAKTTTVAQPGTFTRAFSWMREEARSLANTFVMPGMEPALAGGAPMRLSSRTLPTLERTPGTLLRAPVEDAALAGRKLGATPLSRIGGTADNLVPGVTRTEVKLPGLAADAKGAVPKHVEVPTVRPHAEVPAVKPVVEAPSVSITHVEVPPAKVPGAVEVPPVKAHGVEVKAPHRVEAPAAEVPSAKLPKSGETVVDDVATRKPAATDAKVAPKTGETVVPPAGETKIVPPAGETKIVPPAGETKIVPPAGETKIVPPAGETKIVPPAGETKIVPPAGETKIVAPTETPAPRLPGASHVDDVKPSVSRLEDASTAPKAPASVIDDVKTAPNAPATIIDDATAAPKPPAAKTNAVEPLNPAERPAVKPSEVRPTEVKPAEVRAVETPAVEIRPLEVPPSAVAPKLEAGVAKSVENVDQRIARITDNLAGPEAAAVRENLTVLQTNTRQLVNSADDAAKVNANIDRALKNLEVAVGKNPVADDIAKLARETRELQTSVSTSRNLAVVEKNSQVLVQTGDDIAREITAIGPKAGPAAAEDVKEIARLGQNLGKGADDLVIVKQINERVSNIARTGEQDVADDIARALKPSLQKAEGAALESATAKAATKLEQRVTALTEKMAGPESALARQDVATIQRNVQKLLSGTDEAAATRNIERALTDLRNSGGNSKYADDIAKLTQETREVQQAVSVSRNAVAVERNAQTLATTGKTLGDDALRLGADPAKVAAKADLDEIARLSQNLGKGGDDIIAVNKINERIANISKNVSTEVADDISRTLKPSIQKVEATAIENGALKSANRLEQSIAKVAESVTGPEGAAIRNNLETIQRATRGLVNGTDNAAVHSEDIARAIKNLESVGAKTGAADDIARVAQETRELQQTVSASRRLTSLENTTKTLAGEGRNIGDEAARLSTVPGAKAVKGDLDEISRLSNNLGKTGDDLETVRKINDRIANIGRTGGADIADDVARNLTPKVQKAEATAVEASRMKSAHTLTTAVETEAKAVSEVTKDIIKGLDTKTTNGRVLQQQLQAIQRTADELPTAVNPATEATRLRTMVQAVEKSVPATERAALKATVNNLDNAATELTAVRTMGQQSRVIEEAATTLRGTVAKFQDDVTRGAAVVKPGTEESVRRAIQTVETNSASVTSKLGTTQRIDSEVRALRNAATQLEEAGQVQLARQVSTEVKALEKAETIRGLEITSQQGPILSNIAYNQTLATRTIEQVERDLTSLKAFGNIRGVGRLDTISELHENLQMLRFLAKNDARLMTYVDDAQQALAKIEMSALSKGSRALDANTSKLLAMAEAGDVQALNKLFIRGLQSDTWNMRSLAASAYSEPGALLGRIGTAGLNNITAAGRVMLRPEAYGILARSTGNAAMVAGGATMLYGNFKYHSQLLLNAIERQMQEAPAISASTTLEKTQSGDADKSVEAPVANPELRESRDNSQNPVDKNNDTDRRADLDFAPSVGAISRRINFSSNGTGIAARFSFSPDDLDAEQKIESIIETGKIRRWAQLGVVPVAPEAPVTQNIPVAKTIRIKGADGVSSDPNSHQKTAVTNFSFTRAMALTNQLKLMTGNGDNRGGSSRGTGTVFGGGPNPSAPSLSQNLRTMVAYNSLRTDGNTSATTHRESTEGSGIDQSTSSGGSNTVPQGPTVAALQSNPPAMVTASAPTSVSASSSDPDNGVDDASEQQAV